MSKRLALIAAVLGISALAHADKAFRSGKGATWDCKQDAVAVIDHAGGSYSFRGACKSVRINGADNTVTIERSEAVQIYGASNKVAIGAVDQIDITGAENTVTYRSAIRRDTPRVSDVGADNTVSHIKSAPAEAAPAPADAPAVPAGAHDCAKQPTVTINEGDGNYTFVGACTKITMHGGDNKATIESVRALEIYGTENTIAVGSVDHLQVTGTDNKISYRRGISGPKPKISSTGVNNKIAQTK